MSPPADIPPARRPSRGGWWIPLLVLAAGLAGCFGGMLAAGGRALPAWSSDPSFVLYTLEHGARWALGDPGHADLWSPPMYYPQTGTLGYSDAMIGALPGYLPWRGAGVDPYRAMAAWWVVESIAAFGLAYGLGRRGLGFGRVAAATGAYLLVFSVPRTAQLVHPQLWPLTGVLLMAWGVTAAVRGAAGWGRWRTWALVAAGAALQFYTAFYPLWFTVFALLVGTGWALAFPASRRAVAAALAHPAPWVAAAGCALVVLPLARVYLGAMEASGARSWEEVASMLPSWRSWWYVGEQHRWYGWIYAARPEWVPPGAVHEQVLGLGLLTSAVVAAGWWRWRRSVWGRVGLCTVATLFALTLDWGGGISAWRWVAAWVPGAEAIRAVARIGVWMMLPAALAAAVALDGWSGRRWRWVVLALVVLEQQVRVPVGDTAPHAAAVAALAGPVAAAGGPVYVVERAGPDYRRGREYEAHLLAMWAGLVAGVPVVNGYSGQVPPGWHLLYFNAAGGERDRVRIEAWLDAWMARHPGHAPPVVLFSDR